MIILIGGNVHFQLSKIWIEQKSARIPQSTGAQIKACVSLLCVGATSKLKLSYGKCFYKKFNFLSRAIFGPIFGPNTNINIFEKTNFQYLYLNIQYSETNIRISKYIHIFALYNTKFLIKYEYEYIRKVKFPIFVFEYPIFGVKSLNIQIYSPYTG